MQATGLGAYNRADQVSNHFLSNEIGELQVTGTFIPGIFLAVTAFLIHLVLSRMVATQRQEIGVLKAFGYGNYSLGLHYLKLAFVVVLGGIALGMGVGWYFGLKITELYMEFLRFPVLVYQPGPLVITSAVLISLGSAGIGALAAAKRAVGLPPAEAMREPPARFRAGFIERLGFHRLVPTSVRIILRNLERRPAKAMVSIFGIALAVSLLVVGFFLYFDTIERIIEAWGGPEALEARVRLIEPSAFTKVSALGIEEQRVNVIADLTAPSNVLGDGYRVEGRIVVWHSDSVLQVPVSALFRSGDVWSLFVVEEGRARLRQVEVGQRTPLAAEIKSGVEADEEVIVHPPNEITDGTRVEPRQQEYTF